MAMQRKGAEKLAKRVLSQPLGFLPPRLPGIGLMNLRPTDSATTKKTVNSIRTNPFLLSPTNEDEAHQGEAMKKLLLTIVTVSMLAALSGCVVVPARGGYYYHPHYYRGW